MTRIATCLLLALVWLGGCLGTREQPVAVRYFVPTLSTNECEVHFPVQLSVFPLSCAPHLEGDRLAARVKPAEIEYYSQNRWAGPLDRLLTQETLRFLRPCFEEVSDLERGLPGDYLFTGTVEFFEEEDGPQNWFAKLGVRLTLQDLEHEQTVWSRYFESREPAAAKNPGAVVDALRQSYETILKEALRDWEKFLLPK